MNSASLQVLVGSNVLIETYCTQPGKGRWFEEQLWRVIGVDPEHGITLEAEPRGSGTLTYLGWDTEQLRPAGEKRCIDASGQEVCPDYVIFMQLQIS